MATRRVQPPHVAGVRHLRKHDPVMRVVIDRAGPFALKLQRDRFRSLVRAIVAQQISTAAARSILARLETLAGPRGLTPDGLGRFGLDELRTAGISPQKGGYLLDLVQRARDGRLQLARIGRLDDEAVIEHLVQVKGIGRWTAQMFLIFSLGRLDVFPHDDLGVRMAIKRLYGLEELPSKDAGHAIAERWRPYASIGSWYCWRALEFKAEG
ncbi:MAG: DNA-3-methyladenine glycosylase 2 family protein [Pirellulales bacterium]|nr:DNA-3-methyladenine glycosylase 2 family protein [Pirellulales bacterium]